MSLNDPYKDLDFEMNYRERERAKALARDWAKRAMEERKREALERESDDWLRREIERRERAEAAEEAREWARTLIFVALGAVVLLAIVWLGSAF